MISFFMLLLVNITGTLSYTQLTEECEVSFPVAYLSDVQIIESFSFPDSISTKIEENNLYAISKTHVRGDNESNMTRHNFLFTIKNNNFSPPFANFKYIPGKIGKEVGLPEISGTKAEFLAMATQKVNEFLAYDGSYASRYLEIGEILEEKKGTNYEYAILLDALLKEAGLESTIVYGYVFRNYWVPHIWVVAEGKHELDPTLGESFKISKDRFIVSAGRKALSYKGQISQQSLRLLEKLDSDNGNSISSWISYEEDSLFLNIKNSNSHDEMISYSFQLNGIQHGYAFVASDSTTKVNLGGIDKIMPGEGTFLLYYRVAGEDKKAAIKRKVNFSFLARELSKAILSPFSAPNNT